MEIRNISKYFPGVVALKDISFDIRKSTVHCIIGENGAGKSTLIKILTGALKRNEGTIMLKGKEYNPRSTRDAMNSGMSVLFQELNVVDQLTVEQNLSLGKERIRFGIIRKDSELVENVYGVLQSLDPSISLQQRVADLSFAQKQIVEIAKAISSESEIIIMDEPTAAISEEETTRLFSIIDQLKQRSVTVIYITHRLNEIFRIGDYVTVLRDGTMIGTRSIKELSTACKDEVESCAELIKMMLGKMVVEHYIPGPVDERTKVLELKNVSTDKLKDINFELYKGEILGFYGLIGAGKTEIAKAIYGIGRKSGTMLLCGKEKKIDNPFKAIRCGIAMVPEERRSEGLFAKLSIRENIPVMNIKSISRYGIFSTAKERSIARMFIEKLKIVAKDEDHNVLKLSGGNQQKVVLSKCLNADSAILMLDEPTRGIDVGAKEEIHNLIRDLSQTGKSIIVFSSELPEILNLCDRIVLLYEGRVVKTIRNGKDIDSEKIMHLVTGGVEVR